MVFNADKLHRAAKALAEADLKRRQNAEHTLEPEHWNTGRKKSPALALKTTLGGQMRSITAEDLRTFKATIQRLQGDRLHKGLVAKEVISMAAAIDLERARKEIHHATPFRMVSGAVQFSTNASQGSKSARHVVRVDFSGFGACVASPLTPLKAAASMAKDAPLRFECDCERHTFWYRYIASIGGWNTGRTETGFPKIRNPTLTGVACKHVLRVMTELQSAAVHRPLARMIETERQRLAGLTRQTVVKLQAKETRQLADKQKAKPRTIKKTEMEKAEKTAARAKQNQANKLIRAGLSAKVPETQRKAQAMTNAKEAVQKAMDQQIAKFKNELSDEDIKKMLIAMAATFK
jgi:hypothetical protein